MCTGTDRNPKGSFTDTGHLSMSANGRLQNFRPPTAMVRFRCLCSHSKSKSSLPVLTRFHPPNTNRAFSAFSNSNVSTNRTPKCSQTLGIRNLRRAARFSCSWRHHSGVHRHGLDDQPLACTARKLIKHARFHLQDIAGHMLGYLGKSRLGGLVELSQEQGCLAFGPFGQHGAGIALMLV